MLRHPAVLLPLAILLVAPCVGEEPPGVPWADHPEAFFEDAPALLVPKDTREALRTADDAARRAFLASWLTDPLPDTERNELVDGIERRLAVMRAEWVSPLDARSQLLFLHGAPQAREVVECGQTFVPIEIWRYADLPRELVLYQPFDRAAYRLWLPIDSKRVLYNREMEYWMEQWERMRRKPGRFDLRFCPQTNAIEDATGIIALSGYASGRPGNAEIRSALEAPTDLAAWSRRAAVTPLPESRAAIQVSPPEVVYPARIRQRTVARVLLELPAGRELGERKPDPGDSLRPVPEDAREVSLVLDGVVEQDGEIFETFRVRFRRAPPPADQPMALVFERLLRPDREYVLRGRLVDEVSAAEARVTARLTVPEAAQELEEVPLPEEAVLAFAEEVAERRLEGGDAVMLVPPDEEIVAGLWRAEAVVTGTRIEAVVFFVDEKRQLARTSPPFSAELRLANVPRTQVVRAEGHDAEGELVAADEIVLNQPRGAFAVRILEPRRGMVAEGAVKATAEVVVPPERRVEKVEFLLNDEVVASIEHPPWEVALEVPPADGMSFLAVVAHLDDGSRTEELLFLNAPKNSDMIEVQLVELYTTVTDRSGTPVADLERADFEILEDGRHQDIQRFEPVEDRPLTIGFVVDTSTSMASALPEARQAAVSFLDNMVRPQDRVFVLTFADQPMLAAAPTDDVTVIAEALARMKSMGWTSLHDAVAAGLHVFRGGRGRRAMILLTDGDDTSSAAPFRDVLEFARRSGVAVYAVGLDVGPLAVGVRNKLGDLARATGGRSFFISEAQELAGVYEVIERELRSQYLLAYSPDEVLDGDEREVEVRARGGRLKTRTTRSF